MARPLAASEPTTPGTRLKHAVAAGVLIAVAVSLVYARTAHFGFVSLDDTSYVVRNPHVHQGLTLEGMRWAFTEVHAANWHPLTWLSHMLDYEFYGLNAGGHHLTSVGLHLLNSILLFAVLLRMTGRVWRSAFVAAVFAVHPLQAESVAWIAERKSVLSGAFWMLTMLAYLRYSKKQSAGRYALMLAAFALGLMAKSVLVTLPLVLLMLDWWPLERLQETDNGEQTGRGIPLTPTLSRKGRGGVPAPGLQSLAPLVLEKLPMVALVLIVAAVTVTAQGEGGMTRSLAQYPLGVRLANASVAYVAYLEKMVWPSGLCQMYIHPGNSLPVWQVAGSAVLLLAVSVLAVLARRRAPYVTVGWLWYLVTLVPMIGIVQVGPQAMADRYAYLPMIGVLMVAAWGAPELLGKFPRASVPLAVLSVAAFAACAWVQVGYWRDAGTMFERVVRISNEDPRIITSFTGSMADAGKTGEAARVLRKLSIPAKTLTMVGAVLARSDRSEAAAALYREAIRKDPGLALAHSNLATALARQGQMEEAESEYRTAIQLHPDYAEAYHGLGVLLLSQEKFDAAIAEFRKALAADPNLGPTHLRLAGALAARGRLAEAWTELQEAQRLGCEVDPRFIEGLRAEMERK